MPPPFEQLLLFRSWRRATIDTDPGVSLRHHLALNGSEYYRRFVKPLAAKYPLSRWWTLVLPDASSADHRANRRSVAGAPAERLRLTQDEVKDQISCERLQIRPSVPNLDVFDGRERGVCVR
jgi:hypothetical protein